MIKLILNFFLRTTELKIIYKIEVLPGKISFTWRSKFYQGKVNFTKKQKLF